MQKVTQSINQTNQIGVKYSVHSIGYYVGEFDYVERYGTEIAQDYVSIVDGQIKVVDGRFFDNTAYVIKVKATSVYHDGSKEGTEPIETSFDVYVVESNISSPVVKFDDIDGNAGIAEVAKKKIPYVDDLIVNVPDLEEGEYNSSGLYRVIKIEGDIIFTEMLPIAASGGGGGGGGGGGPSASRLIITDLDGS